MVVAENKASEISVDGYQDATLRMCDLKELFVARIGTKIAALDPVMACFSQPSG